MPSPIETALDEHRAMLKKLYGLEQEVKAALEREAILKDRVDQLTAELGNAGAKADHYLRWCSEITRQMLNINMFVNNAMREAKIEVERASNGKDRQESLEAVEKAISEVGHVAVQHEGKR